MSVQERLLKNRYVIGNKPFAKGSYGKVYLAKDKNQSTQ